MPFRTETLTDLWRRLKAGRASFLGFAARERDALAAAQQPRQRVIVIAENATVLLTLLVQAQAMGTELVAYGREQERDPALDVAGIVEASRLVCVGLIDFIAANFPVSANLALETVTASRDGNGGIVLADLMFQPAETAGIRSRLDGIIAALG